MKNSALLVWLRQYVGVSTASFTRFDVLLYILSWLILPEVLQGVSLLGCEMVLFHRIELREAWHFL